MIAKVISSGLSPLLCIAAGSIFTTIERMLPPKGAGAVIRESQQTSAGFWLGPLSEALLQSDCHFQRQVDPTGSELPSNRTTIGGTAPGGKNPIARETCVETSPAACAISVPG